MHKEEASLLFKALGDSSRVKIVKVLYNRGKIDACKIEDIINDKDLGLNNHLNILLDSGLIISRNEGNFLYYLANKPKIDELMKFVVTPCKCCSNED